jgi:hypothetical protein
LAVTRASIAPRLGQNERHMPGSAKSMPVQGSFLADVISAEGFVEPGRLSSALRVSKAELASADPWAGTDRTVDGWGPPGPATIRE